MNTVSSREHAFTILHRVEAEGAYSDKLLQSLHLQTDLSARDCAFVTQVVKGVLEKRIMLDSILNQLVAKGVSSLPSRIQTILRMGAYQVLELHNISRSRAVSESVTLAKKFGHEGTARLVNAVLRKVADPVVAESLVAAAPAETVPPWIRERLSRQWGPERADSLLEAIDRPLPLALRVNTLRSTVAEVQEVLAADGWETRPSALYPKTLVVVSRSGEKKLQELVAFERGLFFVQDEASAAVVPVLDPLPNEIIVDLCAAPGGKATLLAELTEDRATILAIDPSPRKLYALKSNCERLGITSITPIAADGTTLSFSESVDRVLVDVPCSGLGALGKKKDVRWNRSEDQFEELLPLQVVLLEQAIRMVRSGGIIVYSTCSIDQEEDEKVVCSILEQGTVKLSPIPQSAAVGTIGIEGASMRLWPDLHGSTGAFVCRLEKL